MDHEQTKVVGDRISRILVIVGLPKLPFTQANAVNAYATRNPGWSRAQVPVVSHAPAPLPDAREHFTKFLQIVYEQHLHPLTSPGVVFVQCAFGQVRESSEPMVPIGLVTACRAAIDDVEVRIVEGPLRFVPQERIAARPGWLPWRVGR